MRAVILDDDKNAILTLELNIQSSNMGVQVIEKFTSSELALKRLPLLKPDLVFLDIDMPVYNGFDVLEKLGHFEFEIIFTTGHKDFAIDALRLGAIDYLCKPINPFDLRKAIGSVIEKRSKYQLKNFNDIKIAINSIDAIHYIHAIDIVCLSTDNSHTLIYLKEGTPIRSKKSLKDIENILPEIFKRVHNSHIINVLCVTKLIKSEVWTVEVNKKIKLPVSRRRRIELQEIIDRHVDFNLS